MITYCIAHESVKYELADSQPILARGIGCATQHAQHALSNCAFSNSFFFLAIWP